MPLESLRLTSVFPVTPERLYRAWLDGDEHAKMTGGSASCEPRNGGRHTAWDGYIEGKNLELSPHARIVQSWRTTEFSDEDTDSVLTLTLTPVAGGTELLLVHTEIPVGQGADYETGWESHYFAPMRAYFAEASAKPAAKKSVAKKPAAKKTVANKPGAKKAVAKKAVAKNAVAKNAVAKKAVAKKPVAKKAVAKKPVAKKPAAKKPVATKSVAKKPAAKKPSAKPAKKTAAKKR
jgi:uncharacterized protein YndB with AHSA1/START domain